VIIQQIRTVPARAKQVIPAHVIAAIPAHDIVEETRVCDVCLKRATKDTCSLCGRDICGACRNWHPDDHGDYVRKICRTCFDLYEKYHVQIMAVEAECDDRLGDIDEA